MLLLRPLKEPTVYQGIVIGSSSTSSTSLSCFGSLDLQSLCLVTRPKSLFHRCSPLKVELRITAAILYNCTLVQCTTVFIPLRPAGFIQDCKHFAAGFIGILLHTDAGSIRGRVLLEGGLNWNKYGL